MSRLKFSSFWDDVHVDSEWNDGKSETIPDMSLSVRDILTRFTRGQMELPPIETGDDETFDSPDVEFDDMIDAVSAVRDGQTIYESFRLSQLEQEEQKRKKEQSSELHADSSSSDDAT